MSAVCPDCRTQMWLCICNTIKPLDIKTKIQMIVHFREAHKASNSAKIIKMGIKDVGWHVYGRKDNSINLFDLILPDRKNLILFPSVHARSLESLSFDQSDLINLIVPDGSWSQAARIASKFHDVDEVIFISLNNQHLSNYKLRYNPNQNRICTFEAVVQVLSCLEPKIDFRGIDNLFRIMVDRQLWLRGKIDDEQVFGGLPLRPKERKIDDKDFG